MEEESFIDRLERLLEEKNFQKKDLAEAVGISRTGISTWRVSGALPRADIAIKIARFLNVSVEYLILGDINELDKRNDSIAYEVAKLPLQKQKIVSALVSALKSY
ncbi:MAG: helix-turn-helix domain-containing protein [Treponemataceae bacterium]|nr:helix-turn-helix domain-containing protein [Treponemataceae bacterium]